MRALSLLLALTVAACSNGGQAQRERGDATPPPMTTAQMAAALDTDGEVLHAFITGSGGEIHTSEPFVGRFQRAEVREFAQEMVTVHVATIERALELGVEPENNPVSVRMEDTAAMEAERLDVLSGAALDAAYLASQVQMHTEMLSLLDNVLIPNADAARLRSMLQESRLAVAAHLEHAQHLMR
ncbi:MAG TPA: DUF4142 domain-containing protein [Rhodothermales bacterium]|nr:DUF4142 domain-containing protein [Rhodothermales bacterium]